MVKSLSWVPGVPVYQAEDWMVEEMPILERLMDAVRDWYVDHRDPRGRQVHNSWPLADPAGLCRLFWKTEDAQFAPPAPAPRSTSPVRVSHGALCFPQLVLAL